MTKSDFIRRLKMISVDKQLYMIAMILRDIEMNRSPFNAKEPQTFDMSSEMSNEFFTYICDNMIVGLSSKEQEFMRDLKIEYLTGINS